MSLFFLFLTRGSFVGWAVFGATWITRLLTGHVVGHRYLKDTAAKKHLWLVPLVDLLSFTLWAFSFQGDEVQWRGQRFRINPVGKLVPIPVGPSRASRERIWPGVRVRAWLSRFPWLCMCPF